ncbi:MAG: hypothetical protein Tsb005_00620 [Gammaproteobacteria bacterium]
MDDLNKETTSYCLLEIEFLQFLQLAAKEFCNIHNNLQRSKNLFADALEIISADFYLLLEHEKTKQIIITKLLAESENTSANSMLQELQMSLDKSRNCLNEIMQNLQVEDVASQLLQHIGDSMIDMQKLSERMIDGLVEIPDVTNDGEQEKIENIRYAIDLFCQKKRENAVLQTSMTHTDVDLFK